MIREIIQYKKNYFFEILLLLVDFLDLNGKTPTALNRDRSNMNLGVCNLQHIDGERIIFDTASVTQVTFPNTTIHRLGLA